MTSLFECRQGDVPLLVSIPHAGVDVPRAVLERLTDTGQSLPDTDWFVDRLYALPALQRASRLVARVSRYVIDLNRADDDASLYPGQNTTGLCPTTTFSGAPIYRPGAEPDALEIAARIESYWRPFHEQLRAELDRLRQTFGRAILLDAHSIASRVPRLFAGRLPDWNFGTFHGRSCRARLQQRMEEFARQLHGYSHAVNGRFVGGHITRSYGRPDQQIDAVQLELSQATYLDESTGVWNDAAAERLQQALNSWIEFLLDEAGRT